tara:strand:- start:2124 stop:2555 length:432 start_codon:yes stop_codon:yes gene_type:complete
MSAYVVNPSHIGQLVLWYLKNNSGIKTINHKGRDIFLDAKDLVLYLATANTESVAYRYKQQDQAQDIYLCGDVWKYMRAVKHKVKINEADAYNMCACLRYQSCEHPEYVGSAAEKLLKTIQDCAARHMAADSALWEYDDQEVA